MTLRLEKWSRKLSAVFGKIPQGIYEPWGKLKKYDEIILMKGLKNQEKQIPIEETEKNGIVKLIGDIVFKQYFSLEESQDTIFVNIKNPSGSASHWNEYDRCGFESS